MWLSLQLDRKKKVMLKLAQQLNHAELHKLDTEVHNDCTVYGFSLCYAFVKPCKKYPCLLYPDWYTGFSLQLLLWEPQIESWPGKGLPTLLLLPLSVRLIYSLGWLVMGLLAPAITVKGLCMELHGHQRAQDGEGNQWSQM